MKGLNNKEFYEKTSYTPLDMFSDKDLKGCFKPDTFKMLPRKLVWYRVYLFFAFIFYLCICAIFGWTFWNDIGRPSLTQNIAVVFLIIIKAVPFIPLWLFGTVVYWLWVFLPWTRSIYDKETP